MIISLADAREKGLTHYFTGKPCKFGHIANRQVSNRGCVVCLKKKSIDWAKNNPDRSKEISDNWNAKNKKREAIRAKVWRKNNPETYKRVIKEWRENNLVKYNAYMAMSANDRRIAKLNRTPKWLSEFDLLAIKCKYSVCAMLNKHGVEKWHVDHIVPLQGQNVSGLHVPWNLQVIPASKNMQKSNRLLEA